MRQAHTTTGIFVATMVLELMLLPAMVVADVGKNSCVGPIACTENTGDVKNNSCDGDFACTFNTGAVGNGSCDGSGACATNTGAVGNGSCDETSACAFNTGAVGNGSCDGPAACADRCRPLDLLVRRLGGERLLCWGLRLYEQYRHHRQQFV